ncbi:MAG: M23 family metallopeptidase [Deltaproteobacteria bacterium]|nr:M23 family metallopeptidase [Deltaproteobacteria bacterium]
MGRRILTFFVLTDDASKARQFRIPLRLLKGIGVFGALVFLALSFVIYDYVRIKGEKADLFTLKKENEDQRLELQWFSARIGEIETELSKLNLFDRKLRAMANLGTPKSAIPDQVMGMGGPVEEKPLSSIEGAAKGLKDAMRSELQDLEGRVNDQKASFSDLHEYMLQRSSFIASTPSIWPARGWVTSAFGERISPFSGTLQPHRGIDIANRVGTPVVAPANGVVIEAIDDEGLGKKVTVFHGFGYKTSYGHLSQTFVKVGQKVKRGTKLGLMGNTGRSTGPHLHYEVTLNGVPVDPARYLLN